MLFDVLPVLFIFVALVVMVAIVLRRLPDIATINIETISEAQSAATKRQLLVQRLERKIRASATRVWQGTAPQRQTLRVRARQRYEQLLEFEKKHRPAPPPVKVKPGQTPDQLLVEADEAREAGREGAEALYLELIRLNHRSVKAYYGLGLLYWAKEQNEEARQALEYATRLDHADPYAYVALAKLALDDGRLVEARAAFEHAASLDPENVEYRIYLGDVSLNLKDPESAVTAFESAVSLEPSNPRCLDRLLEACILVGNKRLATATLRRLAEVNPENNKLIDLETRVAVLPTRPKRGIAK